MREKWLLYAGLLLLTLGVFLKLIFDDSYWPLAVIILGVAIKVYFICSKISRKNYRPGSELLLLLTGLILFFSGIYFSSGETETMIHPTTLKVSGITFKIAFVMLFIKKLKSG